jgi:hypothetical protein
MQHAIRLMSPLVLSLALASCSVDPVAPAQEEVPLDRPILAGEPANFNISACAYDSTAGDLDYFHYTFSWSEGASETGVWEIASSSTSGGTLFPLANGVEDLSYNLNTWGTSPGSNKVRWYYLRSQRSGGGWSSWVSLTTNPANIGTAPCYE